MIWSITKLFVMSILFNFPKIKSQVNQSNDINGNDVISSREIKILEKFKEATRDILYLDYQRSDLYLLTWLRASEMDLETAKNRLQMSLQWRKAKSIDSLIDNPKMQKLKSKFQFDVNGFDKHGHSVLVIMAGMYDFRSIALSGKIEEQRLYWNYMYELALNRTRENGLRRKMDLSGFLTIVNAAGFNLRQHACLACFPLSAALTTDIETHYGGFSHSIVVVNAPMTFATITDFVRRFLSPSARESLTVMSHDKMEIKTFLSKLIDDDQLPVAYGGKRVVKF